MTLPSNQQDLVDSVEAAQEVSNKGFVWFLRVIFCGLGIGMLGLLLVARTLDPSPEGMGTHQQILNLPPCGFLTFFGVPCPSCGMTTSWAYVARGSLASALNANVGGALLALFVLPVGLWLTISGWRGRWFAAKPNPLILSLVLATIIAATLVQWVFRLG